MIVLVNITGFSLRGHWPSTVEKTAPSPKQKAIAEVLSLRRVLHLMVCAGRQCRAIAAAFLDAGNLCGTGRPLVPVPIGLILQRLDLAGKPLGSHQAWFAV